jgi:hypothetical protein
MLAFTEDNLRSARDAALLFFLVLHEIGSSHCQICSSRNFFKVAERPDYIPQDLRIAPRRAC